LLSYPKTKRKGRGWKKAKKAQPSVAGAMDSAAYAASLSTGEQIALVDPWVAHFVKDDPHKLCQAATEAAPALTAPAATVVATTVEAKVPLPKGFRRRGKKQFTPERKARELARLLTDSRAGDSGEGEDSALPTDESGRTQRPKKKRDLDEEAADYVPRQNCHLSLPVGKVACHLHEALRIARIEPYDTGVAVSD